MRLVGDHRIAPAGQLGVLVQGIEQRREGLDGDDDDARLLGQRLGQLLGLALVADVAGDRPHHALGVLELVDGVLQLAIQHRAVSDHDHRAEQPLAVIAVHRGELVGGPGDGVGLARAGAVLDQVTLARPFSVSGLDQLVDHIPLVVAREDHRFPGGQRAVEALAGLLVQMQEAPEHLEPGIRLEQLLPQVAGGVLAVIGGRWIARAAFRAAEVERQEEGVLAVQLGGHRRLVLADREMHQRAAFERQQRLGFASQRVFHRAVVAVLALGVFHRLLELAFQLQRGGGDAVDEQHQIQARVVFTLSEMRRVGHLRYYAQAVAPVALEGVRVHAVVGLEAARLDLHPRQFEAMAQHIQGAVLLQLAHQFLYQHAFRVVRVGLGELVPALRPGVLEVTEKVLGIQRRAPVIAAGRAGEPALGDHRGDNVLLELGFLAVRHLYGLCYF